MVFKEYSFRDSVTEDKFIQSGRNVTTLIRTSALGNNQGWASVPRLAFGDVSRDACLYI